MVSKAASGMRFSPGAAGTETRTEQPEAATVAEKPGLATRRKRRAQVAGAGPAKLSYRQACGKGGG